MLDWFRVKGSDGREHAVTTCVEQAPACRICGEELDPSKIDVSFMTWFKGGEVVRVDAYRCDHLALIVQLPRAFAGPTSAGSIGSGTIMSASLGIWDKPKPRPIDYTRPLWIDLKD